MGKPTGFIDYPRTVAAQLDLLVVLAQSPGRVLSRDQIMDALKGHPLEAFDRSIDVHISRIRAVIEDETGAQAQLAPVVERLPVGDGPPVPHTRGTDSHRVVPLAPGATHPLPGIAGKSVEVTPRGRDVAARRLSVRMIARDGIAPEQAFAFLRHVTGTHDHRQLQILRKTLLDRERSRNSRPPHHDSTHEHD